jgi:hypothetical protein
MLALYLSEWMMRQFSGTPFEEDLRQAIEKPGEMQPDEVTDPLGPEPSHEALRKYWSDVAIALLSLRMRRNHTATILKQHWARKGNTFPYFSPVVPARTCLANTNFESGVSARMSCRADRLGLGSAIIRCRR